MHSVSARVVRISTALYPHSAIELALRTFQDQVISKRVAGAHGEDYEELELSLTQKPGVPPNAIDELLTTMLRAALDVHLMRNVTHAGFPRGL